MNLNDYVHHFPSEPKDQIPRDNLIQRITNNFGADCIVQAVCGDSNIGKTNFLAQFCRYYPETAISYFIGNNPLSQLQEEFLYCICNQINFIFGYEEVPIDTSKNYLKILFDRLTNLLVRKIKKDDEKFFIVIDGLEHGLAGSSNERIIDIFPLPTSSKGPYILISIDNKNKKILEKSSLINIDNRYELLPFTRLETKIFLNNFDLEKEKVDFLHEETKGNPGFLREVKDYWIRKGIEDISEISFHIEKIISDQVELIYEQYQSPNIDMIEASAIFPTPIPVSIISLYINKPESYVYDFLKSNDVLELATDNNVDFIKESIRNGLLEKNKNRIIEISKKFASIIGDEDNKHLVDSYTYTLILHQAEEYDKSLELISNPKIIDNLSETDDVTDIIRSIETVLNMASEREDYEKIIELTLKLIIIKTLFSGNVNSLEVQALIAIGKEEEAIRKAHSIPEIINRIRMLARAYTSIKNKSMELPTEALEELKELISRLHVEEIDKEIIKKLAFDLFPIMQEEAINLIEKVFRNVEDKDIFEITASLKSANEIENIPQIIKNPNYGFLIGLFSPHLVKLSFSEIKAELDDIKHTRTKEYLIRNWCLNNTENKSLILGFNY